MPISSDGKTIQITFDAKYVSEVLKVLSHEAKIDLCLIDAEDRALISVANYRHVIMPLARDAK
jgi:DNA polymerase III sliding clamp (beta) subunit (PCNA family)